MAKDIDLFKSDVRRKLDDILGFIAPKNSTLREGLGSIMYRAKSLGCSLYELKAPIAAAVAGMTMDRVLTYQFLQNGNGYEANPIAALGMKLFGEVPSMIATGVLYLLCYGGLGKLLETAASTASIDNKRYLPRNSLVKAGLYSYAAVEAVVSINNYFVANAISNQSIQAFQNYLSDFLPLLNVLPLVAVAATARHYYLKSKRQK